MMLQEHFGFAFFFAEDLKLGVFIFIFCFGPY